MSWRCLEDVLKTFSKCLEDVFARSLEDVLKTSWRHVSKTSWRCLEDVWPRRTYWFWSWRLENVFWRRISKANIFLLHQDVLKTSSSRRMLAGIESSEYLAKNELTFTTILSQTDTSKNYVNNKSLSYSISSFNYHHNPDSNLHRIMIENPLRIIFEQISFNSIRNKFDLLINILKNGIDIFMISETKAVNSFPVSQFTMAGYSIPSRVDWRSRRSEIILFVRENIPF